MSFRLGRIWGFPIEIDVSWFIIFALVAWTLAVGYFPRLFPEASASANWGVAIVTALLFFVSVLLHELSHSFVAIRNGLPIGGITLFLFGGVSKLTEEPRTPELELKMAIAGPLTSVALGFIFWGVGAAAAAAGLAPQIVAIAGYLAVINIILGIFNLVPGFPLDGGRVLRAILWRTTGSLERSTRYASYAGQGFGYLLMLFGFFQLFGGGFIGGIWLLFIGWFLVGAAQSAYQQMVIQRALSGVPVTRIMQRDMPALPPQIPLREVVDDYFMRQDYSAYPVVEDGCLLGVLTVDEVREVPREQWETTTAGEASRRHEEHRTIGEEEDAWHALSQMAEENTRRLLVVREGRLEGVVSRDGILNLVRAKMQFGM